MQAALLKSTRLARAPCASLNKGARSPRHCVVNRRRLTELHVLAAVSLSCLTRTRTERVAELVALLLSLTAGIVVKCVLGRRRLYHPSRWVQVYDRHTMHITRIVEAVARVLSCTSIWC